jgi:hypothetical protein
MAMPWMFSGRRWVATKDLQALRYPPDSPVAQPLDSGKYISTYWITEGRYEDHLKWTVATNQRLLPDGRIYLDRTHVYTSFQRYRGATYRDATGPRDVHALEYPYGGLVMEIIDSPDRDAVVEQLKRNIPGPDVAMGLFFEPMPLPQNKMSYVKDVEGVDDRVTVLWFTDGHPGDHWDAFAQRHTPGTLQLVAPFIPTRPGTDTYVDQLR